MVHARNKVLLQGFISFTLEIIFTFEIIVKGGDELLRGRDCDMNKKE